MYDVFKLLTKDKPLTFFYFKGIMEIPQPIQERLVGLRSTKVYTQLPGEPGVWMILIPSE